MKQVLLIAAMVVVSWFFLSCNTTTNSPPAAAETESTAEKAEPRSSADQQIKDILAKWEEAIRTRNKDLLESLYWHPSILYYRADCSRLGFDGIDAVAEFRLFYFDYFGPQEEYTLPEPELYRSDSRHRVYRFDFLEARGMEGLDFELQNGVWKLAGTDLYEWPKAPHVTNSIHAGYDIDKSSYLEEPEMLELEECAVQFFNGPHDADSPFDMFFDPDEEWHCSQET